MRPRGLYGSDFEHAERFVESAKQAVTHLHAAARAARSATTADGCGAALRQAGAATSNSASRALCQYRNIGDRKAIKVAKALKGTKADKTAARIEALPKWVFYQVARCFARVEKLHVPNPPGGRYRPTGGEIEF